MSSHINASQMAAMEKRLNCQFQENGVFAEMAQPLANYQERTAPIDGVAYG